MNLDVLLLLKIFEITQSGSKLVKFFVFVVKRRESSIDLNAEILPRENVCYLAERDDRTKVFPERQSRRIRRIEKTFVFEEFRSIFGSVLFEWPKFVKKIRSGGQHLLMEKFQEDFGRRSSLEKFSVFVEMKRNFSILGSVETNHDDLASMFDQRHSEPRKNQIERILRRFDELKSRREKTKLNREKMFVWRRNFAFDLLVRFEENLVKTGAELSAHLDSFEDRRRKESFAQRRKKKFFGQNFQVRRKFFIFLLFGIFHQIKMTERNDENWPVVRQDFLVETRNFFVNDWRKRTSRRPRVLRRTSTNFHSETDEIFVFVIKWTHRDRQRYFTARWVHSVDENDLFDRFTGRRSRLDDVLKAKVSFRFVPWKSCRLSHRCRKFCWAREERRSRMNLKRKIERRRGAVRHSERKVLKRKFLFRREKIHHVVFLPNKSNWNLFLRWSNSKTVRRARSTRRANISTRSDKVFRRPTPKRKICFRLFQGNSDISSRIESGSLEDVSCRWRNQFCPSQLNKEQKHFSLLNKNRVEPAAENIRANSIANFWQVRFDDCS